MKFGNSKKIFASDETEVNLKPVKIKKQAKIVIRTPQSFDDVQEYAQELIDGNIVIVNLSELESGMEKNRIFDYLNGVAYIVKAHARTAMEAVLIYSPSDIAIDKGDGLDEAQEDENR